MPMISDRADVIVVGAGPAGSTAAKLLADRGYSVLLVDRANFPRHKTCASWINRLAFDRFTYLRDHLPDLIENPFYGVAFYDRVIARKAEYAERRPSGYLSLRSKFDDGVRRIAVSAGARFIGGCAVDDLDEERDGVLCANADISFPAEKIHAFYGERFPFRVYLEYRGIQGYGWVFPKKRHICVGIGALLKDGRSIRPLFQTFFQDLRERNHLPPDTPEERTYFDIDPVGGVYRTPSLVRGRIMLIGDAAGFVSGSTGEGIYPGMVSAEIAVGLVHQALQGPSPASMLERYNQAWRSELSEYVKRLPGGEREKQTRNRLELIFKVPLVSRIAGRAFLYGEKPSIGTLVRSFMAGA